MEKEKFIQVSVPTSNYTLTHRYQDSQKDILISDLLRMLSAKYKILGDMRSARAVDDVIKNASVHVVTARARTADSMRTVSQATRLGDLEFAHIGGALYAHLDFLRAARPSRTSEKVESAIELYRGETAEFKAPFKQRIDEIFHDVAKMDEEGLFKAMLRLVKNAGYKPVVDEKYYIYARGEIPIVLNAHVDTVFDEPPKHISIDKDNEMLFTTDGSFRRKRIGLGADDRAGVAIIISILERGYRPGIAFTRGEERGDRGAIELVQKYGAYPDTRYIIGLDRKGSNDAVYYGLTATSFINYISKNFGFERKEGTTSDVSVFGRAWNVAIVNLSVGYENAHSEGEIQSLRVLRLTADRVEAMLQSPPERTYSFRTNDETRAMEERQELEKTENVCRRARPVRERDVSSKETRKIEVARNEADRKLSYQGFKTTRPTDKALRERGMTEVEIGSYNYDVNELKYLVTWTRFNFGRMVFLDAMTTDAVAERELTFENLLSILSGLPNARVERAEAAVNDLARLTKMYPKPPDGCEKPSTCTDAAERAAHNAYLESRHFVNVKPGEPFLRERLNIVDNRDYRTATAKLEETFWWTRFDFVGMTYKKVAASQRISESGRKIPIRDVDRYIVTKPLNVIDMNRDGFFEGIGRKEANVLEDMIGFLEDIGRSGALI